MDRNYLLALGLSFLVFTVWMATTTPKHKPVPPATTAPAAEAPALAPEGAQAPPLRPPAESAAPAPSAIPAGPEAPSAAPGEAPSRTEERTAELATDLVRAQFTTRGGGVLHWELRAFDDAYLPGRPPVDMVAFDPDRDVGLFTPLDSLGSKDLRFAPYLLEKPGERSVSFVRTDRGVTVRKTYRVEDGSYLLHLRVEVTNAGGETLHPTFQVGWPIVGKTPMTGPSSR